MAPLSRQNFRFMSEIIAREDSLRLCRGRGNGKGKRRAPPANSSAIFCSKLSMEGWKYKSGASYVSTNLLHSGQNKTYVSWGTLRPRALLPIVTGVQFPGLTVYGWAGTCSFDKTWGHYWQVNMVTWLLLGNIYHCVMVFSSYPHLLAQVLWVQLEPPPCLFALISLPSFLLCSDMLCWDMLHNISAWWLASSIANRAISLSQRKTVFLARQYLCNRSFLYLEVWWFLE